MIKCNQKHLFVLDHHRNEEPRSSSASLGFGEITLYNPINPVRRAFNFNLPVDTSTELDHATCSASHFHTSENKEIPSSNPEGGDGDSESKGTVEGQVLSRYSDNPLLEDSGLEKLKGHHLS